MLLCPCFFLPHFIYYALSRALISPHPAMITAIVLCQGFKTWWTISSGLINSLLFSCCFGGDEKQIQELPKITPRQGCSAARAGPCSVYRRQTRPWDEFMGSHLHPDGDPSSPRAPVKNREGLNCRAAACLHPTEWTDPSHKSLNILTGSERFFFLDLTLCGTSGPAEDGWWAVLGCTWQFFPFFIPFSPLHPCWGRWLRKSLWAMSQWKLAIESRLCIKSKYKHQF